MMMFLLMWLMMMLMMVLLVMLVILVLMALAEWQQAPAWALHALGLGLLAGRIVHAVGLSQEPEPAGLRAVGMALTFTVLIGGALVNLGLTFG